jgi:hypothetical protein
MVMRWPVTQVDASFDRIAVKRSQFFFAEFKLLQHLCIFYDLIDRTCPMSVDVTRSSRSTKGSDSWAKADRPAGDRVQRNRKMWHSGNVSKLGTFGTIMGSSSPNRASC